MVVPDYLHGELNALHEAFIQGCAEARGEWEVQRADGSRLTILADAARLPDPQGGWQKATFVLDISQRKQFEKELQRAKELAQQHAAAESAANQQLQEALLNAQQAKEQADRASAVKSEFLAHMSHEIRTPLNGILGMLNVMNDSQLSAENQDALTTARRAGEHLLDLLNNVLDSSALEEGKLHLEKVPFSPQELCRDIIALFRPQLAAKAVECVLKLENPLPELVVGDHGRIRQILGNLLSNAVKFTQQGSVSLGLSQVRPEHFEFTISDTGSGIPQADQASIFEPFTQSGSGKQRRQGTGLGLTICKRLCESMGGSIHMHSIEGQGTTFHVLLPLPLCNDRSSATQGSQEASQKIPHSFNNVRVLVVEDNIVNQKVIRALLARMAVQCDIVGSGEEAESQCCSQPYAAIFMDIQLPDTDGYSLTGRLREVHPALQDIPIIALTASSDSDNERRCQAAGMAAIVCKPIQPEHLAQTLHQVLSH